MAMYHQLVVLLVFLLVIQKDDLLLMLVPMMEILTGIQLVIYLDCSLVKRMDYMKEKLWDV